MIIYKLIVIVLLLVILQNKIKTKWDYFSDIFGLSKNVYVNGKSIYTRYPVRKVP
jgi:hypothetical protein